jgi:hypothetical protein
MPSNPIDSFPAICPFADAVRWQEKMNAIGKAMRALKARLRHALL